MDRLNLQERIVRIELDRHVGPRQSEVDEQGAEPAIGLDDAIVAFIAEASGQVGWRSDQEAPAGRRACDEAAPQHQASGILERSEERRRITLDVWRRDRVEVLRKIRELCRAQ